MLQNAYFLAKIGADTAENEQHFAEILPEIGNYPTAGGRAISLRRGRRRMRRSRISRSSGAVPGTVAYRLRQLCQIRHSHDAKFVRWLDSPGHQPRI